MKQMIRIILLMTFLVSSCSTSKITKDDFSYIQNHWIHSHEEDSNNERVYRPSEYSFPPSRGREEIILSEDGNLKYRPISPNDEPIVYKGSWKIERSNLELHFNDKIVVYKIEAIDNSTLKLK